MKWTYTQLTRNPNVVIDEDVLISPEEFATSTLINGVKDVHFTGNGYLEGTERFYVNGVLEGTMLCPDAITGEELEVPLRTEISEIYAYDAKEDEDVRSVNGEVIDVLPALVDAILMEAPLQVTEADPSDYPSGDGWRILSEEEYEKSRKDSSDPRLAKLKELLDEE